jgi:hypothetical protein
MASRLTDMDCRVLFTHVHGGCPFPNQKPREDTMPPSLTCWSATNRLLLWRSGSIRAIKALAVLIHSHQCMRCHREREG